MSTDMEYTRGGVLLDLQGVTVTRGGTLVLRDMTAQVHDLVRPGMQQGQIVGLLGPSGIGKTTLFHVLAGLLKPDKRHGAHRRQGAAGAARAGGRGGAELRALRAPLGAGQPGDRGAKQAGMSAAAAKEASMKYLERFGLAAHADKYPAAAFRRPAPARRHRAAAAVLGAVPGDGRAVQRAWT